MLSLFTWLLRSEQGRRIALGVGGMLLRRWISGLFESAEEEPAPPEPEEDDGRSWWPILLLGAAGAAGYWLYRSSQREESVVPDWTPLREPEPSNSPVMSTPDVASPATTPLADVPEPDDVDRETPADAEMEPAGDVDVTPKADAEPVAGTEPTADAADADATDETGEVDEASDAEPVADDDAADAAHQADETVELPVQPATDLPADDSSDEDEGAEAEADGDRPDEAASEHEPALDEGSKVLGQRLATDDLKVVEGIGPKIEQLLNDNGFSTWHDLANADTDRLQQILRDAGSRFQMHDPSSWPAQADLLVRGEWQEFASYTDRLNADEEN